MSICVVAGDVSKGRVTVGLLVLLYYMHHDTFSNCFAMSSFRFRLSMSPRREESLVIFFHEISRQVDGIN